MCTFEGTGERELVVESDKDGVSFTVQNPNDWTETLAVNLDKNTAESLALHLLRIVVE